MSDMTEKYQQHYNKILTGTLTDTIMKSISYQANIQLANEIIAEQEKSIVEAQKVSEDLKKELESVKSVKTGSENTKITNLENQVKGHQATISKLQSDLYEANKLKTEYENVKHQVQHLDTYRNEVSKANDKIKTLQGQHQTVVAGYEDKIKALTEEIELLKTPVPTKKAKVKKVATPAPKAKIIKQDLPGLIVKDGGNF